MKIAIMCYPTFGGSGVVATELGVALARKGHEVHFITYQQPVRLALLEPNLFFHQVHVPEYSLFHYQPYELALSSKLADIVKLHKIDVVHVHYAIPHAYAAYMSKQMLLEQGIKIPIVTTLHGTDITLVGKHPFYKTAVTFSINQSDMVTCVSQSLRNDTLKLFNVNKDIQVIYNFIDTSKYALKPKDCSRRVLAGDDEKIITHVSNFRKVKRVQDVVKVFYLVQKAVSAKLIMVGEGPELEDAEQQAQDYGITDKVIFLGNSEDVDKILRFSDAFLLPSESESFGLSALEAMANSVPVISSNTGGLPELNLHGQTGFLCGVGQTEEMASHILSLFQNPELLKTFRNNAKKRSEVFDKSIIIPKYEALYEQALKSI